MGKIYCWNCGAELNDSVKFCSKCGTKLDDNNVTSENKSLEGIMERIEAKLLIMGVVIGIIFQLLSPVIGNGSIFLAYIIAPFVVGYLSQESIKLVMIYAFILSLFYTILYFMFPPTLFIEMEHILMIFVFIFLFSFVGNFIKIKLKS